MMDAGRLVEAEPKATLGNKQVMLSAVLMVAAIVLLHVVCLHFFRKEERDPWDLTDFYPLSVFKFRRPSLPQLGLAVLVEAAFVVSWRRLTAKRTSLVWLFCAGLGLAVLSNLLNGWRFGIDYPTATLGDSGIEYYNDAIVIRGPLWFLSHFNAIQFELLEHARTHPPGPVLFYYFLYHLLRDPALISIGVTAVSIALALPSLRRLLALVFGDAPPAALLLYLILPANLVYGLAVVDAPIAALFLAALVCFIDDERRATWLASALLLALSLCFTFGALFLLPVFFGAEWLKKRRATRSLLVVGVAAVLVFSLKPLFGYDWLASFLRASAMENEKGFLLFAEPRRYLWYRLGAVAEILLFFSPIACWLMVRGWNGLKRGAPRAAALAWLGPLSLALMLLSGAMKIGEAARICLFILPYLSLPVIAALRELRPADQFRVAQAVFAWGLVMQLFGFYQW